MAAMHIGVNALYLIPGGVGGTEIYLRSLLQALAAIDFENRYTVFTNRETGPDLVPPQQNFHLAPQAVSARNRPARIVWEQTLLPINAARLGVQVLFNPGFTAPVFNRCPNVTVFHGATLGQRDSVRNGVRTASHTVAEDDAFIGAYATVLGVRVGAGAIVAPLTLASADVPAACLVSGNPMVIRRENVEPYGANAWTGEF